MNPATAGLKATGMLLPSGWRVQAVSDMGRVVSGGTPSTGVAEYWGEGVPWCTPSDVSANGRKVISETSESITRAGLDSCAATVLPKGALLVCTRATIGECAIAGVEMATNQGFKNLIPSGGYSTEFLYHALQAQKRTMVKLAGGSTFLELSKTEFERMKIWVPPYPEQERIGEILGTWQDGIEKLERLISAQRELKRGLSDGLLTGRRRFQEFGEGRWRKLVLGDLVVHEPRVTRKPKGAFLAAGIRSHGKGVFLKPEFPGEDIALDELFKLRAGDLVVNITFGWEGAVAIVPPEADGALVSHRFPTFTFREGVSFPGYLRHVIRQRRFVYEMGLASPGGAGRNRVLSKTDFLRIPIELPSLPEQERIAAVLNACERGIELLQKQLAALTEQKRGLMQKLLTGEVRVKAESRKQKAEI